VVSSLQNYATPLLRYELGDYAQVGASCACGRGLPTLQRVMGRQRNLLRLPDGSSVFPGGWREFSQLAPIRQFQLVRTAPDRLEINLVTARPLEEAEGDAMRRYLCEKFRYDFTIVIHYLDLIERGANGKLEEFRSEVL
jgi:phenylacetate-CoA ligase